MNRAFTRLEGLSFLVGGLILYRSLGGAWLWLLPLLVLPDISLVGLLAGKRIGAILYNTFHTYVTPLAVLGIAYLLQQPWLILGSVVWVAHVGMDRALGYELRPTTNDPEIRVRQVS